MPLLNIGKEERKKETKIALRGEVKSRTATVLLLVAIIQISLSSFHSANLSVVFAAPIRDAIPDDQKSEETESIQNLTPQLSTTHENNVVDYNDSTTTTNQLDIVAHDDDLADILSQNKSTNKETTSQHLANNIIKERFSEVKGHLLLLFALLVLINLIVIFGNILVILAVYATAKLRNVTNIFIVSLATADLLLGVFVLPYALTFEVSNKFKVFFRHSGV